MKLYFIGNLTQKVRPKLLRETINPENHQYYTLPLESGTTRLTLETLNKHSEFRFPMRPYLLIRKRRISFKNEILTIGISLAEEKEELVYIKVLQKQLKVSCSVDTDHSYLSRYAYFALYDLIGVYDYYDFDKYYWPDFFNPRTGKSRYLDIINDRAGLDIKLKPKYAHFYKPGQELFYPFKTEKQFSLSNGEVQKDTINQSNPYAIGYCLADTSLSSGYSNHFPFLVGYAAIWKEHKKEIKGFHHFLMGTGDANYDYTPMQDKLNVLCGKMQHLAPIQKPEYNSTEQEKDLFRKEAIKKMNQIYVLWQKAIPLFQGQPFTHYHYTYGMRNVKGKPRKHDMHPCTISTTSPELCFLLTDKGDYYELELRFKDGKKIHEPNCCNPTFFIHAKSRPYHFYFLCSLTDYQVLSFFGKHKFKLSVLKCHYQQHFKAFIDRLVAVYELKRRGFHI